MVNTVTLSAYNRLKHYVGKQGMFRSGLVGVCSKAAFHNRA